MLTYAPHFSPTEHLINHRPAGMIATGCSGIITKTRWLSEKQRQM
jgi:hypothetical protein